MNIENLFLKYYNNGLTDAEIASKLGRTRYCIGNIRRKLKLKSNKSSVNCKHTFNKEELYDLVYNQKLSDRQIAKIYNLNNYQTVVYYRKKFGFLFENRNMNPRIELTHIQKELIFGCTLGDGYIKLLDNDKNACFCMNHCIKQEEYIKYKFEFLKNLQKYYKINTRKTPDRMGVYRTSILCSTQTNESINEFRYMFYKNRKKIIPIEYLDEYYTPFAMAIHYCDDGSYSSGNMMIATNSFEREELEKFIDFLYMKYDIRCTISKANRIRIRSCCVDKFIELVKPYIIDEMKYKIGLVTGLTAGNS